MDYNKLMAISTSSLAFSTFMGVLIAMIYYAFQIKDFGVIEAFLGTIIYIDINLLFFYMLKKKEVI